MPDKNILKKKAELILSGRIVLDRGVIPPFPLSRSTAGPGAGTTGIVLGFNGTRVKLEATREPDASEFLLVPAEKENEVEEHGGKYRLLKNGELFLEGVELIPTLMHAPEQAFINLDARCRFGCLFCASPHLKNYHPISPERWVQHIRETAREKELKAIAITSGVPGTVEENIRDFVYVIEGVRDLGVPIGVEPYVETEGQIVRLKEAGADEIKLNIQSFDRDIFRVICPNLDYDNILRMLRKAVEVFGRNRVTSNIIIGFGETDENVLEGVESLAKMGVAATIRTLHITPLNRPILEKVLNVEPVTTKRLLGLRDAQERIFRDYGIDTREFRTMCFACKGCDLEVF